jgi:hypothetical protein
MPADSIFATTQSDIGIIQIMPSRPPTIPLDYASAGTARVPRRSLPLGKVSFALTIIVLAVIAMLVIAVQVGRISSSSNNTILRYLDWCVVASLGLGFLGAMFRSQREFAILAIFIALIEFLLLPTFMTA